MVGEVNGKDESSGEKSKDMSYVHSESSISSHRTFLKKKSTRSSLSPQTSSSSLSSFFKKLNNKRGSPSSHGNEGDDQQSKTNSDASRINSSLEDLSLQDSIGVGEKETKEDNRGQTVHSKVQSHKKVVGDENNKNSGSATPPGGDSKDEKVVRADNNHNSHHHHHHLSLRRFLKKLKHSDSRSSPVENKDGQDVKDKTKHRNPLKASSILESKYGVVDRLLGTGASGSVNLLHAKDDPTKVFAVKKFRSKLPNESDHDYKTKVKNEFKVGDYLKHQNLVHTFELIKESKTNMLSEPDYYIVMEYCKYDFFNLVMSGLMDRNEIACYLKQIVHGVEHLHQNGLAHRDLKLDNCVVNEHGILKLIDFGSVVQFKKERANARLHPDCIDDKHVLSRARGVVGSDPYLAPEVFEPSNFGYDPREVDVWSIAIIFCCMSLRRFPWKVPKVSDPSYRSFIGQDDSHHDEGQKPSSKLDSAHPQDHHNHRHSSNKLLGLLPTNSRPLIGGMLQLNPEERYTIKDVMNDSFFKSIDFCQIEDTEPPTLRNSENHTHHLVTEEELEKIREEKESIKKLKESGMA